MRPDLVPVDHEPVATYPADRPGREEGEERERRGVHDVVAPPIPDQEEEDSNAETERRPDPPASSGVEAHLRRDRDHVDAIHTCILALGPLADREVIDLVSVRGEPLAQVTGPTFRAAYCMRVE